MSNKPVVNICVDVFIPDEGSQWKNSAGTAFTVKERNSTHILVVTSEGIIKTLSLLSWNQSFTPL
jgi:hypothetical protein